MKELKTPPYHDDSIGRCRIGLAVESMKRHTTNEGHELFAGLESAGYQLAGYAIPNGVRKAGCVHVPYILRDLNPGTVLLQDKREWDVVRGDFREPAARFTGVNHLRERGDIFKLTVLKDAHQKPDYHRASADEIGCHAWVVYYDVGKVHSLAPYTRKEHLVRTWHSVDSSIVPGYSDLRTGCLLSGAVSSAYPLRKRLFERPPAETVVLKHPGYHRNGSATPEFLKTLSRFKVAICTASIYQYALRKIVEATACGCMVVTNLKEPMPVIDGNLVRAETLEEVHAATARAIADYDPERQEYFARVCQNWYDYREVGKRLSDDVEALRKNYSTVAFNAGDADCISPPVGHKS